MVWRGWARASAGIDVRVRTGGYMAAMLWSGRGRLAAMPVRGELAGIPGCFGLLLLSILSSDPSHSLLSLAFGGRSPKGHAIVPQRGRLVMGECKLQIRACASYDQRGW